MTTVVVAEDGALRFVHDDAVLDTLGVVGDVYVARASHVEPEREGTRIWWVADLRPVGGPIGRFMSRAAALAWEKEWIESSGVPTPIR